MNAPTKIATLPLRQVQDVRSLLVNDQAKQQLASVAAKHMSPERLMRVTANAIRTTPKLQEAEPLSFLGALMQCAALGLEPNSVLGHAYLVPFKNSRKGVIEVQTIIGYKGYKALAWRSGMIESMHADVVYDDDEEWSYSYGTDTHLRHRPGSRNGDKTHAYCHVKMKDGQAFVVMPWADVLRVRDASQNWRSAVQYNKTKDSPWFTAEDIMGAKTAVRYLFQRGDVPISIEMADAMAIDNDHGNTRVDYTSYALNPAAGPEIDGDFIEGEGGPVEDEPETETAREPEPKKAVPKPKAAEKPKAEPKDEPKADAPEDKPEDRSPDQEQFRGLYDMILADLQDAGSADEVVDLYEAQIEQMKAAAPDLHKALLEEIEAFRNGAAE